ncbi:hypothetical protein CC80DRAFT_907 [Byssothecium circinans]|uniref:Uncharacterized protein n=1 Tax=Byssothecium circinans TaxID=147558 RepID=A0A6A5UHL5_9PLEO|nr:hypothetical protein CC80DRAFT_907 [Byssothecium circinans]
MQASRAADSILLIRYHYYGLCPAIALCSSLIPQTAEVSTPMKTNTEETSKLKKWAVQAQASSIAGLSFESIKRRIAVLHVQPFAAGAGVHNIGIFAAKDLDVPDTDNMTMARMSR